MKLSHSFRIFGIATSLAVCAPLFTANAAGGLMVTPSRVEFKDGSKAEEVKLINRGNETTSYRISFQNLRMKKDGSYEEITSENKGEEKFADDLIKFSPKRVTLKPGETQTVRLVVGKKPAEKAEFRSHLLFKEEAPADFGNNVESKASDNKKISVTLRPVFAISIPVIVRNGELKSEVVIDNLVVKTDPKTKAKQLSMQLNRTGQASVNGSVVVTLAQKVGGDKVEVGTLNNVSVYSPYPSRDVVVNLELPKNVKIDGGILEAKFYAPKEESVSEQRGKILAQKSLTVN